MQALLDLLASPQTTAFLALVALALWCYTQ